jgi:hypothetical protein
MNNCRIIVTRLGTLRNPQISGTEVLQNLKLVVLKYYKLPHHWQQAEHPEKCKGQTQNVEDRHIEV